MSRKEIVLGTNKYKHKVAERLDWKHYIVTLPLVWSSRASFM